MCGILGYVGTGESENESGLALDTFLGMLKMLEYRGYDSWGVAYAADGEIRCTKDVGKIPDIDLPGESRVIIGHTRWATHGKVTRENAHPHISQDSLIGLAHNGIIENFMGLRAQVDGGYTFRGETDTEVLTAYLDSRIRESDVLGAFRHTLEAVTGTYAICFIKRDENRIYFARKDSPLVIGLGESGARYISSDVTPFLDKTKNVIYLEDSDYGWIDADEVRIFHGTEEAIRKRSIIDWDIEKVKKGDFEHFMLKEISEQADTVKLSLIQDEENVLSITRDMQEKELYIVACGTSYNAAKAAEYEYIKQGVLPHVIQAHEFPNYQEFLSERSLVLALSQSGETIDLIDSVKKAKARGAEIVGIVNVHGSSLDRLCDRRVYMNVGPEVAVLSTKSYTAQLAIMMLIAGCIHGTYEGSRSELGEIIRHIFYLTSDNARYYVLELSRILRYASHLFTIGRERDYATAMEAALKIKEVSYIHAEGFAGGEIKHGPIAMIENGTPCIVFVPDESNGDILSNAQELRSRGAFIIGIADRHHDVFDYWIKVLGPDKYSSILRVIPIQILAYYLAVMKGLDPDKPRNLAKSVTVK